MNKVLLVGRLVRDPETQSTSTGIKYTRFTIAVDRQFGENEADFIPVVTWRSQAEFVEKYIRKGALVSIEGRFNSSTYQNADGQTTTRYEVVADRIQGLESKTQTEQRLNKVDSSLTQTIQFEKEMIEKEKVKEEESQDVPWELDL